MSKKLLAALFLFVFGISVSAQSITKQWEYLEVSQIQSTSFDADGKRIYVNYRSYNFFNAGKTVSGTASLDWLGKSGWELVGAISTGENNSDTKLVFKRIYNEQRSKREIEELEKTFKAQTKTPTADLIDLDAQEARQKLDEFNRREEERLRAALSRINDVPVKIISVKSSAYTPNKTSLAAEIVVDGTSVLLKDGNKYRSSEAKNYLQQVGKQIVKLLELDADVFLQNYGRFQIGEFSVSSQGEINIGVSAVVNYQAKQNVVAQGVVRGNRKEVKP